MIELFKNKVILGLTIANALFLILAVSSCNISYKYKKAKDKEIELRFESQEKAERAARERLTLEESLQKANAAIEEERALRKSVETSLNQQQLVNESMQAEIDKLRKLKDKLEEEIKGTLAAGKTVTRIK